MSTFLSKNQFDAYSYMMRYDDVRQKWKGTALEHWQQTGQKEGRTPGPDLPDGNYDITYNPVFNAKCYLSRPENNDVRLNGIDPFTHWTKYGQNEGRIPGCNIYTPVAVQQSPSVISEIGTTLGNLINPNPGSTTPPAPGQVTSTTLPTAAQPAAGTTTNTTVSSTVTDAKNAVTTAASKVPTWAWWAGGGLIVVILAAVALKSKGK